MKIRNYLIGMLFSTFAMGVSAATIYGDLTYAGAITPRAFDGGPVAPFDEANFLDFNNNAGAYTIDPAATGDFAGITSLDLTVFDILLNPFEDPTQVWSANGFSFWLSSVTPILEMGDFLVLKGSGYITHVDFETTNAQWVFSANSIGQFNFSSSTGVPEPSTLALFGFTMLGMGLVGRRRKAISAL